MNYEHDRKSAFTALSTTVPDERVGRHNTYNTLNNLTSFILNYCIICIIKFKMHSSQLLVSLYSQQSWTDLY